MYKFAIIGKNGLVARTLLQLLQKREILFSEIRLIGREDPVDLTGIDVAFLCAGSHVSQEIAPLAKKQCSLTIDLSSAFRNDPSIPLILPPINGHLIKEHKLVATPNCIVSILLSVLGILHKQNPIRQIWAATYQAASGAGRRGPQALEGNEQNSPFPQPLKNNLFLHESERDPSGYCGEEQKIIAETRKILESPGLDINVRSVRVPVERCHSIAATVTFAGPLDGSITHLLQESSHLRLSSSPSPFEAHTKTHVFYAPIRASSKTRPCYDFWIVGDQLLRGAALNALETFEAWAQKQILSS